jgi:hypothetical protein
MVAQVLTTMASSSTTPSPSPLSTSQSSTPQDFQNQMMMMLTETFTKLTTVMMDTKTSKTKADWPKFSSDTRKFRHWYLAIVAQILLAPWKEFYNSSSNTLVISMRSCMLNYFFVLRARYFKTWYPENIFKQTVYFSYMSYPKPTVPAMFQR